MTAESMIDVGPSVWMADHGHSSCKDVITRDRWGISCTTQLSIALQEFKWQEYKEYDALGNVPKQLQKQGMKISDTVLLMWIDVLWRKRSSGEKKEKECGK